MDRSGGLPPSIACRVAALFEAAKKKLKALFPAKIHEVVPFLRGSHGLHGVALAVFVAVLRAHLETVHPPSRSRCTTHTRRADSRR